MSWQDLRGRDGERSDSVRRAGGGARARGGSPAAACAALFAVVGAMSPRAAEAGEPYALGVVVHSTARGKVPRKDVDLTAKVQWRGPEAELRYRWEPVGGELIPYGVDTRAPRLELKSADLVAGGSYHLRLTVTADFQPTEKGSTRQQAMATHDVLFEVNAPPVAGTCELEARWLPGGRGLLKITAPGWQDEDKVLRYQYTLVRGEQRRLLQSWTAKSAFSIGVATKLGERMHVECEARDLLGDITMKASRDVSRDE